MHFLSKLVKIIEVIEAEKLGLLPWELSSLATQNPWSLADLHLPEVLWSVASEVEVNLTQLAELEILGARPIIIL